MLGSSKISRELYYFVLNINVKETGSASSGFMVVSLTPSDDDKKNGFILSGSQGYEFSKWGTPANSYRIYIYSDLEQDQAALDKEFAIFIERVNLLKPAIILTLGNKVLTTLCPQLVNKKKKSLKQNEAFKASCLSYYSGSIVQSPLFNYLHYLVPTLDVPTIWAQWSERDIVTSIDIARAVDEYEYFKKKSTLQPLPSYNFILDPSYDSLILFLRGLRSANYISTDIETLRPKKSTEQFPLHPGFPYTIALAPSTREAVSFPLWNFTNEQFVNILRELQWLFLNKIIVGQNFFSFDLNFLEAFFGFQFNLTKIRDTKLRHHILHPELPHKLQFLCKQYTRQSYYKDEGKGFSPKSKQGLLDFLRYGALDVVVTAEVYEGQEQEFEQRSHLA